MLHSFPIHYIKIRALRHMCYSCQIITVFNDNLIECLIAIDNI